MQLLNQHPKATMTIAVVVIGLALANLLRPPSPPDTVQKGVEEFHGSLADQTRLLAAELESGDEVVLLMLRGEVESGNQEAYENLGNLFEASGITVRHTALLDWDAERGWISYISLPYREFLAVAKDYPDVDAIISYCGPPHQVGNAPNPESLPRLMVTRVGAQTGGGLRRLLEQGRVSAATVAEKSSDPTPAFRVVRGK